MAWVLGLGMWSAAGAAEQAGQAAPASMADLFALDDPREKPQDDKQHSKSDDLPLPDSREALFDLAPGEGEKPGRVAPAAGVELPESRDALFGAAPESMAAEPASGFPLHGYFQAELGRIYASPAHWSKVLGRLELGTQGRLDGGGKWKLSGRIDYNAVYDLDDYYASNVRDDQRTEFQVRETYVDFSAADLEWRLGRQHIVWGEMVGLFFADVVSAKDLREFVLPDFEVLRIPQWAARANPPRRVASQGRITLPTQPFPRWMGPMWWSPTSCPLTSPRTACRIPITASAFRD